MEQITMNQTPGYCQEKELKNLFQSKLLDGGFVFPWCKLARLISFPNRIGSTREKPILMAARVSTRTTSHL